MDNVDGTSGRIKTYLKRNLISIIFLISLAVIVSVITYYRVLLQIEIGGISDGFDFLANAAFFAGQGFGYSDLLRPPFFPFLISIFIKLGYASTNLVFILDGIIFIIGVIGLFMLLKLRFNDSESFLGALLYATFPIVITVLGVGFSDLVSASITIWGFYFLFLGVKKDPKLFYLALPFFMFAFLSRYNSILLLFPVFLYILFNKDKINFKHLIGGFILSLLTIVPVLLLFLSKYGSIIYPFMNFGSTSTASVSVVSSEAAAYYPSVLFFIVKFPDFVGPQGFLILFLIALGLILSIPKLISKIREIRNSGSLGLDRTYKIKILVLFLLGLLFIILFSKTSYLMLEPLFFVIMYLSYDLLKGSNLKFLDMDLVVLAWFMAIFIFHSTFVIKDNRYFVLMVPPVAYMLILGLRTFTTRIKLVVRGKNTIFPIIAAILIFLMLLSTASQLPAILDSNNDKVITNQDMLRATQWLMNYDPNYKEKNIYSDLWPNFSWYLKTNVKPVPVFKGNQTYVNGIKNYTFDQNDSDTYNSYLTSNNAYYYISVRPGLNLTSYTAIKVYGNVTIYQIK